VVSILGTGEYQRRSRRQGAHLERGLRELVGHGVTEVRCLGLWAGMDIDPGLGTGREVCERLLAKGVLAKETHGSTIRLGPPLTVTRDEVDFAVTALRTALDEMG
jgi:ornithine--oxo-acid transaminase